MAEGQTESQNTQHADGSGKDGSDNNNTQHKLIFGKYKSLEEAERGHKELERKYHEGNERYVQLEAQVHQAQQYGSGDDGYGRGGAAGSNPQGYAAVPHNATDDGAQILTRLYTDPKGTLAEVEERATQRAIQRMTAEQRRMQDYQTRIARWAAENPDVAQHGDLLTHYVTQTDGRLAPETRLNQAAEAVRKRVLELKKHTTTAEQTNDPTQFVDGATSSGARGSATATPSASPSSSESVLKSYVAQRNNSARKPLAHGGQATK